MFSRILVGITTCSEQETINQWKTAQGLRCVAFYPYVALASVVANAQNLPAVPGTDPVQEITVRAAA